MTPLLAQGIALRVVFISLIMLALMGDLFWLQRRAVAEPDHQREGVNRRRRARPSVLQ